MKKIITILALVATLVLGATPAWASDGYGNESVWNSDQSNRGLIVSNDGQSEFVLGIGEDSIGAGYYDVDEFRLKGATPTQGAQCARWRTSSGTWTPVYRGPREQRVGEHSLIVQVGTVTLYPYTLQWVCAL